MLLEYLETANSRKIIDLIGVNAVQDFLWVVSNGDPFYCDPEYVESIIDNTKKRLVLKQIEKKYSFHAKQPKEIVCIGTELPTLGSENTLYVNKLSGSESISVWDTETQSYKFIAGKTKAISSSKIDELF
jgi:hypothetical protein